MTCKLDVSHFFWSHSVNVIDLNEIWKARGAVWFCAHAVICSVSKNKFEMEDRTAMVPGHLVNIFTAIVCMHIFGHHKLLSLSLSSRTSTAWFYAKIFNLQTPSQRLSCFFPALVNGRLIVYQSPQKTSLHKNQHMFRLELEKKEAKVR